jgi:hypothetical protein
MNYTKILIQQDGAYALPEVEVNDSVGFQWAVDNAVKFRDDDYKYILLFGLVVSNEVVYDCPSGFKIVIEKVKTGQRVVKTNGYPTGFEEYFKEYATLKNTK